MNKIKVNKINMNKNYTILSVGAVAVLCAGIGIGCAMKCCNNKIAVIDVTAVVAKSEQVQVIGNDLAVKKQELAKWLQDAQEKVKAEKDKEKQDALSQQYNAEFTQKRELISKDYNEKLQVIDKSINDTIAQVAKENGYKTVLSKGVVVYGGTDITEEVIKVIK